MELMGARDVRNSFYLFHNRGDEFIEKSEKLMMITCVYASALPTTRSSPIDVDDCDAAAAAALRSLLEFALLPRSFALVSANQNLLRDFMKKRNY